LHRRSRAGILVAAGVSVGGAITGEAGMWPLRAWFGLADVRFF
jgi:hypothetical protein